MNKISLMYDVLYDYYQVGSEFDAHALTLSKKYNNDGFRANSHTMSRFYLDYHDIVMSKIKLLRFNGN